MSKKKRPGNVKPGGQTRNRKQRCVTLSEEADKQIKWMIENNRFLHNRSLCIEVCVSRVYFDEVEKRQKEKVYNAAIKQTIKDK
jgi:hypothetical protein